MEDEERFQELKSKFFGIRFTDGTIQVHVLESVQEHFFEQSSQQLVDEREWQCTIAYSPMSTTSKKTRLSFRQLLRADG